jgi:hypothetical protein
MLTVAVVLTAQIRTPDANMMGILYIQRYFKPMTRQFYNLVGSLLFLHVSPLLPVLLRILT